MNEVREVSTSDIKNSEKVHMGDRSPPRRALGAAGEGEDREDSPGQGADSPPLGNLPPREQSSCQLGTPPGGRRRPASYVRAHGPSIRETDGVLRTFAQRVPSKPAWTHREAFLAALGPLEPFTTRRGSRAEASDALGPVWASRGQPGASRGGGPGQPADERKGGEQEKSRRLGNGHQHQHRGLPPPGADDPGFGAGGHRSATQEARNLPPSPRSKPPYLGGSTPPTVNTLFRWCQPPGLRQVGRAGQWRQTAAALRAPWRRPRREEPSRLCWLVSTTTHALCSFASRVRAEDAAGRDEAAGPTRSAQWAAEGAGEARREGSGQGPRAPAAGASKGRGSRVRPYGRELAPDYLLQSSPPSFRC
ncbi:unnamed protein product [Prorocentrum cordatum]|uniref:Uncharacterized protein n=1 Tax=Prorocentrum cordatum TaxID=2364126 RepID=A0ABN9TJA2_9DINO|nr:unnamed protein product [Polarella glacialis]